MSQPKYLYLGTRGHRSGKPHEIEIWYVEHQGCFYLIAEKREAAHWVQNIRANPAIRFRLGEVTTDGTATTPADPDLIAVVKSKMDAKHGWSVGLVVEIAKLQQANTCSSARS